MALEVMKSIVEAEQKAEELKAQALADAEAIRTEAKAKSAGLLAGVKREAKAREEQMVADAVAAQQETVKRILAQAGETCGQVRQAAAQRMDEAVTAIIGKVVGE